PGVSAEQSIAGMKDLAKRMSEQYVENRGNNVAIVTLNDRVLGDIRTPLRVLLGAVVLVLLIACANVANLLLAGGSARLQEISVRAALGAGRGRLVRQLLTESVLLSLIAGILGVLLAVWGVKGLMALTPNNVPRINEVRVDGQVLLFTAVVTLAT